MSTTSSTSPISPLDKRDIRSASQPFKRDKDVRSKWSNGARPSAGVTINYNIIDSSEDLCGGSDSQKEKVRPRKQYSQVGRSTQGKTHANKAPKPNSASYDHGSSSSRLAHKIDAQVESNSFETSSLSKSLLELLPQHVNNTNPPITTTLEQEVDVMYSFDNVKGPGRKVELEGLVEKAEKKWREQGTEAIVKGEYEVLDGEGESVVINNKAKGKRSPKQKSQTVAAVKSAEGDDDDGFELI